MLEDHTRPQTADHRVLPRHRGVHPDTPQECKLLLKRIVAARGRARTEHVEVLFKCGKHNQINHKAALASQRATLAAMFKLPPDPRLKAMIYSVKGRDVSWTELLCPSPRSPPQPRVATTIKVMIARE